MTVIEANLDIPAQFAGQVFGALDLNVKKIERAFDVSVISRDSGVKVLGSNEGTGKAVEVLKTLLELAESDSTINEQTVDYAIDMAGSENTAAITEIDKDIVCRTFSGKTIKPKTLGQKKYVDLMRNRMIVFGLGPAGTGKTYLAMAMAITAFKKKEVERIILTRPAIEAGEKLGFLPGDLQSKVDPYLRPLYDALFEIMGAESFNLNMEKGLIEVAPLAYMRGRTLDNAFIILDEAQNTTPSQMKMFLTRIGFGSQVVVTGDQSQKDLPESTKSGLDEALRVLGKVEEIGFANLTNKDVVRHPLVQRIVKAYEDYEKKHANRRGREG